MSRQASGSSMDSWRRAIPLSRSHTERFFVGAKLFSFVFLVLFCCGAAEAAVTYSIFVDHPEEHLFHVTVTIPDVHDNVTIQMPAWNATYQIRDFASRIRNLHASDKDGNQLPTKKIDKQTWVISGNSQVEVKYDIFWDEPGPFASQLNSIHAFMNLAEILVFVPDRRNEETGISLVVTPPNWRVVSALDFSYVSARGSIRFYGGMSAPGYDALVDAPIELGAAESFELPGVEPKVSVAVHGENWNKRELEDGLTKIVRYETQLMGGAPYERYQFIFHIDSSGAGGGGMEHANSTAIGATSSASAISTAAHEFFHLWNVKRIRPQSLEPIDYSKEMYTPSLWFAEGVTSTYAAYAEVRTGLWNANQFYEDLANQIQELQDRPARKWQSVEESSLNAWLEKYPRYNKPEYSISYYNKGQLDGFLLDVLIRDATDNHKSLDDVMRSLNENFAKKGRFYNDSADIEATAENVAGVSFKDFFAKYVAGTDELPYSDTLAKAGLSLVTTEASRADLGFDVARAFAGSQISVSSVNSGSPAEKAGLRSGDVLVTVDGQPAIRTLFAWPQEHRPGDTMKLRVRRSNAELELSFAAGSTTVQEFRVAPMHDATEKQRRILEGLLQGKTN
jgi:predicted metalloprotease with PDZ domain